MKLYSDSLDNILHSDHNVFEADEELLVRCESTNSNHFQVDTNSGRIVAYERMHCRLFGNLLYLVRLDESVPLNLLDRTLVLFVKNSCVKVVPINKSLEFILELSSSYIRYYFLCQSINQRDSWIELLDGDAHQKLCQKNLASSECLIQTNGKHKLNESVTISTRNASFSFECDNLSCLFSAIRPFVWIVVSYRICSSKNSPWIELGTTEAIHSRSPRFATSVKVPFYDNIDYKIELFHSFQSIFFTPILFYSFVISKNKICRFNRLIFQKPFHRSSLSFCLHLLKESSFTNTMDDQAISLIIDYEHEFPNCLSLRAFKLSENLKHLPNVFTKCANLLSTFIDDNHYLISLLSELIFFQKDPNLLANIFDLHRSLIEYLSEQKSELMFHSKRKKFFRESSTKLVEFLQSVPINFQQYTTKTTNLRTQTFTGGAIAFHQNLFLSLSSPSSSLSSSSQSMLQSKSQSLELFRMLSIYNHLMFVMKSRQYIYDFIDKHQITHEHIPREHVLYHKSLKFDGIQQFYEVTVEFCLQIVQDQIQLSLVSQAFKIIQQNLTLRGIECMFEDQYEPIDLTYLNVRACCVKIQEMIFSKKHSFKYCDIVSVNGKLLSALLSLEKTLLTVYSSYLFSNIDKQEFIFQLYRKYSLSIQSLEHLSFFVDNCPIETFEQISKTNLIPIVYETLLTCGGNEKRMLWDMVQTLEWLEGNAFVQFSQDINEAFVESFGPKFLIKAPIPIMNSLSDSNPSKFSNITTVTPTEEKSFDYLLKYRPIIFLFNMGVNSEENIAHLKNETALQYEINGRMFLKLVEFKEQFYNQNQRLNDLMVEIEKKIHSQTRKDVQFLVYMKDVCHTIAAIGVTCCKSGKDRTSMSVTWEHTRRQLNANHINDRACEKIILFSLRKNGVRIKNALLNIGMNKYAFNPIQRFFLPKILQPPLECCLYGARDQLS